MLNSHPMCRTCFGQYQASSAALGWPGVWVSHVMHVQHRWLALVLHSHTAWQPTHMYNSTRLHLRPPIQCTCTVHAYYVCIHAPHTCTCNSIWSMPTIHCSDKVNSLAFTQCWAWYLRIVYMCVTGYLVGFVMRCNLRWWGSVARCVGVSMA